ncbi:MAG TPA: efflux RND transporter periplasmic adaptor subunit [Rhizomicrobium sp.]|nr:efflux RND transporter periplasmic adaptor subunit [Rhizomicrobium sp.]
MKRTPLILLVLIVLGLSGWLAWWLFHNEMPQTELVLYGNVDLREIDLAFNNSERIAQELIDEGDHVRRGQLLARVDTSRLTPQVAQAVANVEVDVVNLANARRQYDRMATLWASSHGRAISKQDFDSARATMDAAAARQDADEAQLALLRQELKDAELFAPTNATVRSRIMEPGDMASPSHAVFTLAVTDPKWVRVYVSEPDLGKVHPGARAYAIVDAFPGRRFPGWIGFVSSVAEFTPKNIETEDLRTSLVYEVRVYVRDPNDDLRLGMPATVHIPLSGATGAPRP